MENDGCKGSLCYVLMSSPPSQSMDLELLDMKVGVQLLHTLIDVSLVVDFCRFLLPGRKDLPDWFLYPLHALT